MKSGLEQLIEWMETSISMNDCIGDTRRELVNHIVNEARSLLAEEEAAPVESLAELAKRKGFAKWNRKIEIHESPLYWEIRIELSEYTKCWSWIDRVFTGKTYSEAESKARAYLNTLPDHDGKEK